MIERFTPAHAGNTDQDTRDTISEEGSPPLTRGIPSIAEKHLTIAIRPDKSNNKISQRQYEKFQELLKEGQDVETE